MLRTTNQYVEVLATGTGKVRATSQYVEVLARFPLVVSESLTDTITVGQDTGVQHAAILNIISDTPAGQTVSVQHTTQPSIVDTILAGQDVGIQHTALLSVISDILVEQSVDFEIFTWPHIVSNVLAGQSVGAQHVTQPHLVSDILPNQSVGVQHAALLDTVSDILLEDSLVARTIFSRAVDNELEFGQGAHQIYPTENSLTLVDDVDYQLVHLVDITSTVGMGQTLAVSAIRSVAVTNAVQTITQVYNPDTRTLYDVIAGLDSSVALSRSGLPLGIQHLVPWANHVHAVRIKADAIDVSASNELTLDYGVFKNQVGAGINTIQWGSVLQVDSCKPTSSSLILGDIVTPSVDRARIISTDLELGQAVAFVILTTGILTQYHPFVGSGVGPPTTINGPMPGITAQFQLVYPAAGTVTDSVSLRSPDFGNKDQLSFNRISRETRGGSLIVFADPNWPKIQTLVLSFSGLHRNVAQALLTFLNMYLGKEVGLIDWEQRYWKGIIVTPENPVIEDSKDSFSASFNFEGEMDTTWTPQVIPVLQGTPVIPRIPEYSGYCEQEEPVSAIAPPSDVHYAEADQTMVAGQVVYIEATGHVALAMADAVPQAGAIGLLFANIGLGGTAMYLTEGSIALADWTAIVGTTTLIPGALYFLSNSVPGGMSTIAPSTGYVVPVGRATSATTIDIEVQESVRLC